MELGSYFVSARTNKRHHHRSGPIIFKISIIQTWRPDLYKAANLSSQDVPPQTLFPAQILRQSYAQKSSVRKSPIADLFNSLSWIFGEQNYDHRLPLLGLPDTAHMKQLLKRTLTGQTFSNQHLHPLADNHISPKCLIRIRTQHSREIPTHQHLKPINGRPAHSNCRDTEMVHGRARAPSRQSRHVALKEVRSRVPQLTGAVSFYFPQRQVLRGKWSHNRDPIP
jgi:hypothetical protein